MKVCVIVSTYDLMSCGCSRCRQRRQHCSGNLQAKSGRPRQTPAGNTLRSARPRIKCEKRRRVSIRQISGGTALPHLCPLLHSCMPAHRPLTVPPPVVSCSTLSASAYLFLNVKAYSLRATKIAAKPPTKPSRNVGKHRTCTWSFPLGEHFLHCLGNSLDGRTKKWAYTVPSLGFREKFR